jgi:uncharacterized protein (DUF885 family)
LIRLKQFPTYFEQQINLIKKRIQTGFVQPKVVLQGFENSVKAFIHDSPEDSVFYAPFNNFQGVSVDVIQQNTLLEQASLVITHQVFSTYYIF